jgi:hypothetical protein
MIVFDDLYLLIADIFLDRILSEIGPLGKVMEQFGFVGHPKSSLISVIRL